MTHQVAIVEEEENLTKEDNIRVIKEKENYFDKIMAVESKDLKFYFDPRKQSDDDEYHDDWMYCYFMEVCPHQQDLEQLSKNINKTMQELYEIMDTELPPRIPQNVHGYFHLGSQRKQKHESNYNHAKLPTRLDLCNHWDKESVTSSNFMTDEGPKVGNFVFFYAIDCKTKAGKQIKPVGINPKPRAIKASYDIGKMMDVFCNLNIHFPVYILKKIILGICFY